MDKVISNEKLHALVGLKQFTLYKFFIIHPPGMSLHFRAPALLC